MSDQVRVLIVEDCDDHSVLLVEELRRGGFEVKSRRVETRAETERALEEEPWDLVVCDYFLPGFGPFEALAMLKERNLDIPFVVVSGAVGEEVAVEVMKAGAQDYVLKRQLTRLVPAVRRELAEAKERAERRALQGKLLIAERMGALGLLTAGVAHELNNPLAVTLGNVDLAETDVATLLQQCHKATSGCSAPPSLQELHGTLAGVNECLSDTREALLQMRDVVHDLRLFARGDEKSAPVDVRRPLDLARRLAMSQIRHRARLVQDYQDVHPVFANESSLAQVFLNLLLNAAQAIPEGAPDKNEVRILTRTDLEARQTVVTIQDTGVGFSPQVKQRLFEPFFTTKPLGVGTGLGLMICERLVASNGGTIEADSEPGKGAQFTVRLPCTEQAAAPASAAAPPTGRPQLSRRLRILIVDDETMVRSMVSRLLADHEVVARENGAEALALLKADQKFDVILSDLMMPKMGGLELHGELARCAPALTSRMIFLTGGAYTAEAAEFFKGVTNPTLQKPFDSAALAAAVSRVIG